MGSPTAIDKSCPAYACIDLVDMKLILLELWLIGKTYYIYEQTNMFVYIDCAQYIY